MDELYITLTLIHEHILIDTGLNIRDLRPRLEWLNKHTSLLCLHKKDCHFSKEVFMITQLRSY